MKKKKEKNLSCDIAREVEKLRFVIFTMAHLFQNTWQVAVARVELRVKWTSSESGQEDRTPGSS